MFLAFRCFLFGISIYFSYSLLSTSTEKRDI